MQLTFQHIYDFIDALPGGNVRQYARLLNTTPRRINLFLLEHKLGKRLVKQDKVRGPQLGSMPHWANSFTERGVLTADAVPNDHKIISRILANLPEEYRPDAEHIFKMMINQSAGVLSFESAVSEVIAPYAHLAHISHEQQQRIMGYDEEIKRLERIVELQQQVKALGGGEARPALTDQREAAEA